LAAVLSISAGIKYQMQKNNIRAVIMNQSINAVNEPRGNKTIFTAHEGTVLNVIKSENNWYFVALPNGASGWVQKQYLEII
jgi:SH3-like domain-containing protein